MCLISPAEIIFLFRELNMAWKTTSIPLQGMASKLYSESGKNRSNS